MPAYEDLGYQSDFPNAENFCKSIISLPIFDNMPIEFARTVVKKSTKYLLLTKIKNNVLVN